MLERIEVVKSPVDVRDYQITADKTTEFPETFGYDIKMVIKNQGASPTCTAHAISSLLEYHHELKNQKEESFSTEFIYGYRDEGYYLGDGMVIRDALKTIRNYGDPLEKDCPGNNLFEQAKENVLRDIETYKKLAEPHKICSYYRCSGEAAIKTALMKYGPVVISMNTYLHATLEDDVYTWSSKDEYGCHCVLIIGWNELGWIVQNSWGEIYGGDGCFILPYNFRINEAWGVTTSEPEGLTIRTPNGIVEFFSSLLNKIANFFSRLFRK